MTINERSSKKQKELLNFVESFVGGNGYGPSYREIMRALGYKSVSTVAIHINGLIAKGYLIKRTKSARSLEVVSSKLDDIDSDEAATQSNEKWLVTALNQRFALYKKSPDEDVLNEIYVLIGALKVLGLEGAHVAMIAKLQSL